jgi:hypothetical protein
MREVILTASKDWLASFDVDGLTMDLGGCEREFDALALQWLNENFGNDILHACTNIVPFKTRRYIGCLTKFRNGLAVGRWGHWAAATCCCGAGLR